MTDKQVAYRLADGIISSTEVPTEHSVLNWGGINFTVQRHPPLQKRGTECVVHVHTEVVPEEDHHIFPREYGGKTVAENMARICSNAHGNVHYFIDLLLYHEGKVPWSIARTFGQRTRELARAGYEQIVLLHPDRLAVVITEARGRLEAVK